MDIILQFHNDLATLPKSDIYALAKFYNLSGSFTDLLWLISIKHYYSYHKAELKGAQLEFAEKLPKIIEIGEVSFNPEFLEKLNKLIKDKKRIRETKDVDKKKRLGATIKEVEKEIEKHPEWKEVMALKKRFEVLPEYYSWILQSYLDRTLSRLEDIETRLIPAINHYNKLKELGKLKDKTEIKQLKGLEGLEDYLDNYKDEIKAMEGDRAENIEKMDIEGPIVYDGEKVVIRHPKTKAAACYFGRDTRWCTAKVEGYNHFEDYNEKGPLYIIIPKDPKYPGEKYQFHENSQQYLNEKDKEFDMEEFIERYKPDIKKIHELTKFFNNINNITDINRLVSKGLLDYKDVERLDLAETNFSDVKSLKNFTNLQRLYLDGTDVSDLTPLKELTNLQKLYLDGTNVSDLTPLKELTNLQELEINDANVSDLTPIKDLTNLQRLYITMSNVTDLTPLKDLTNLKILDSSEIKVSDLTPLKNLTNLQELYLYETNVTDLTPLKDLTNLQLLNLDNLNVSDLTPLKDLINLQRLSLEGTNVSDLTPLKDLTKLENLNIKNTNVSDLTPLKDLHNLKILDSSEIKVSDLTPLKDLTNLENLNIKNTNVSDLTPLKDLTNLQILSLNKKIDITPLEHLTKLKIY